MRRGGENSKMNLSRRFASVFLFFFQQRYSNSSKILKFYKIFVILNKDLKAFCIIRYYTEVFRTLYRSF